MISLSRLLSLISSTVAAIVALLAVICLLNPIFTTILAAACAMVAANCERVGGGLSVASKRSQAEIAQRKAEAAR